MKMLSNINCRAREKLFKAKLKMSLLESKMLNSEIRGEFLDISSRDPRVFKNNRLHVDIFWIFFIKLMKIM